MKLLSAAATALALIAASPASAGGLTDPVLEQDIIIDAAKTGSSSSAMVIVALTGLIMLGVTVK